MGVSEARATGPPRIPRSGYGFACITARFAVPIMTQHTRCPHRRVAHRFGSNVENVGLKRIAVMAAIEKYAERYDIAGAGSSSNMVIITIPHAIHPAAAAAASPSGVPTVFQFFGPESGASFSQFSRASMNSLFGKHRRLASTHDVRKNGLQVVLMDEACLHTASTHDLVTFTGWLPQLNAVFIFIDNNTPPLHNLAMENRRIVGASG